ncbi:O-antigen ligase family protein [Microbacterium sp. Mu-80]|uniref:O-antigen ligase family protein n=1 Tax=Microbacterium bandirmense TaxID=3122050 RepID=A0ABU8LB64_9MICO
MAVPMNALARLRAAAPDLWAGLWRWTLIALGVAAATYLLLDRAAGADFVTACVLAGLVVGAVLTRSEPLAIALMATPAIVIAARVGIVPGGLTVSDAALAVAFGVAILLGNRDYSPPMRALLWLNAIYQFATLFTVIVNPFAANTIEWFHAWLLVSGALIVGWAIGRAGKARLALTLLLLMAAVYALGTFFTAIGQWLHGDFFGAVYPTWPWPQHKNAAGTTLAFCAFIAYVNPDWARLSRRWMRLAFWVFVAAMVLTQSRQAAIGLVVALLIYTLRQGAAKHILLAVALAVPGIFLVVQSVIEQVESQNKFNSVYQRLDWLREVYALWKHEPIFGHGLRYWYVHPTANFQPPQAEVEVVASAGLVGLLGFAIMWVGVIIVLWRVNPRFGMLAFGVVLARIVQAQFDLFWVAVQVSTPFLIAGICLGAQAYERARNPDADDWWAHRRDTRARDRAVKAKPVSHTAARRLARSGIRV